MGLLNPALQKAATKGLRPKKDGHVSKLLAPLPSAMKKAMGRRS